MVSNAAAFISQQRLSNTNGAAASKEILNVTSKLSATKLPTLSNRPSALALGITESSERLAPSVKERLVSYVEPAGKRPIRHLLNFDSPRTKQAAGQLGICFEDCIKK